MTNISCQIAWIFDIMKDLFMQQEQDYNKKIPVWLSQEENSYSLENPVT